MWSSFGAKIKPFLLSSKPGCLFVILPDERKLRRVASLTLLAAGSPLGAVTPVVAVMVALVSFYEPFLPTFLISSEELCSFLFQPSRIVPSSIGLLPPLLVLPNEGFISLREDFLSSLYAPFLKPYLLAFRMSLLVSAGVLRVPRLFHHLYALYKKVTRLARRVQPSPTMAAQRMRAP